MARFFFFLLILKHTLETRRQMKGNRLNKNQTREKKIDLNESNRTRWMLSNADFYSTNRIRKEKQAFSMTESSRVKEDERRWKNANFMTENTLVHSITILIAIRHTWYRRKKEIESNHTKQFTSFFPSLQPIRWSIWNRSDEDREAMTHSFQALNPIVKCSDCICIMHFSGISNEN